jgi:sugar phosphate isomerase/epimerase
MTRRFTPDTLSRRDFLVATAGLATTAAWGAASAPKPGCQTNAWDLDPQHFDLLLTALGEMKELKFEGFETNLRFLQPQLDRVAKAKAEVDAIGLQFVGAHTGLPNYKVLGAGRFGDQISTLATQARQFGAQALVISHGGLSPKGEFAAAALEEKAQMLNEAGLRCADAGIRLAYHNHQPEFRNQAAEETGLLRLTDAKRVSLMFDIGHAWLVYPEAVKFFEQHQDRVFGLHVRDFHNRESVPLGSGEFPLRDLAATIQRTGWHGWLIDEEERPNLAKKPGKAVTGPSRKTMHEVFGV